MENKLNCKLKPSKTLIKSKFIQQKLKARSSFFLFVSHFQFSTRSPHQILHIHLQLEGTACCILHLVPWMCSIGTSNDDHNFQSSSIPSSSSIKHIPYIYRLWCVPLLWFDTSATANTGKHEHETLSNQSTYNKLVSRIYKVNYSRVYKH